MSIKMKPFSPKKQQGAVLAFSLVMLLLLTLVSTSMIQQNKVQISVATNAGQQINAFATVETAMRQAQAALESLRYANPVSTNRGSTGTHHCKSGTTNSLHPIPDPSGTLAGLPAGVTAEIHDVYCNSNYSVLQGAGTEFRCIYSGPGVRNLVVGNPEPTSDNVQACLNLNSAGTLGRTQATACNMEVYTLQVSLLDATATRRTVESKFEIDCSGDI